MTSGSTTAPFQPITFELDGETRLFGWFHAARGITARRCGVVLCNPFAEAALSVHRSYRVLAETLAAAGYPTLRFDYHGTGDSAGGDADPARLAAWLGSIDAAIETCKRLGGVRQVVLFGLRFGGMLAATAAAGRDDIAGLMLWAPVVSGRKFVRELRMLHATSSAAHAASAGVAVDRNFDGLEAAGFRHSAETIADIGRLDLLALPAPSIPVVLVDRDDVAADTGLADRWTAAGTPLRRLQMPGYASMMRDAQYAIVPDAVIGALLAWLLHERPEAAESAPPPPPKPATGLKTQPPVTGDSTTGVYERPLWFGASGELFGIVARPDAAPNRLGDIAVILINAGGNHRIGPSRLTVPIARYLAALGCTTVRIDLAGLGDSLPIAEKLPIFDLSSVDDVRQAIDLLSRLGNTPPRRFVLVGLCSGGFVAMHAAMQDARINSQVIMNLPAFEASTENNAQRVASLYIKPFRFYLDALLRLDTWRRAVRGGIDLRRILLGNAVRLLRRISVQRKAIQARLRMSRDDSIAARFKALCQRDCRSLIILSANDGAIDEMETHLGINASKMRNQPNFRHVILEGADHTFTSDAARRSLLVTLRGHFESLPDQRV